MERINTRNTKKWEPGRFVRYKEGCKLYGVSQTTFEKIAKAAKATYKIDKIVLVNLDLVDAYLEMHRL